MSTTESKMRSAEDILRDIEITLKIIQKKIKEGKENSCYSLFKDIQEDVEILHKKNQEYVLLDLSPLEYQLVKMITKEISVRPEVDKRN